MTLRPTRAFMNRGKAVDNSRTFPALDGGADIFIPGPVGPPPGGMLVGASFQNSASLITTDESQLGQPLAVLRAYDTNFPTSYNNSKASLGGSRPMVISHVMDTVAMGSGSLDAQYNAILDGAPVGRKIWWTIGRHEPDVKINGGQFTVAQWKTSARRMADMVHARGNANWKTVVITTMQPWDPIGQHAYDYRDFWMPGYTDLWTVDKFNPNSNPSTNPAYKPLSTLIGDAVNYFGANSIPWGITESNAYDDNTDRSKKANWITNGLDYCANNGCVLWCYWDKGFSSDADQTARRLASSSTSLAAFSAGMAKYNT